jgi:N-acetyl-beta-hexosaminidase
MAGFICRIGKRQVQKSHTLDVLRYKYRNHTHTHDVLKYLNSGNSNSAENRRSKSKYCKAEENNHTYIYKTNNLEIVNGKLETDTRGKFILLIIRD